MSTFKSLNINILGPKKGFLKNGLAYPLIVVIEPYTPNFIIIELYLVLLPDKKFKYLLHTDILMQHSIIVIGIEFL